MVIGGKSEVRSDTSIGKDDGSPFEHVEAIGRRRGWTGLREVKGNQGRMIVWEFGTRIRLRVMVRVVKIGFGFGIGWRFGGGGGGGRGVGLPAGFAVGR